MEPAMKVITLGAANCYLLKGRLGYVLIDTGVSPRRKQLLAELEDAGCVPGTLRLIILTHGDYDHVGNAAFLRDKYGAPIAMHAGDSGMVENANITSNRKAKPDQMSWFMRLMIFITMRAAKQGRYETFKPDLALDENFDLTKYGLHARIVNLPGHSKGSIGVFTSSGILFCGDFLYHIPGLRFVDDNKQQDESIEKVHGMKPHIIYPGHGKPILPV